MIFSIRDLSFELGSVLLEGWFALAARAGCALLILLAAWLVRRWLSKKGIPALLARKWHFNGTPILLRSFAVPIQRMCTAVGVYLAAASLPWAIPGIARLLLVCFRLVMTLLVCEGLYAASDLADLLLASDENPALIKEISPWLMQFKLLGEYGREVLCMLAAQCDGKKTELEKAASHAKALQVLMKKIDATYNQNGFQPGVKTGSCHLKPAFDRLYQEVVQRTGK